MGLSLCWKGSTQRRRSVEESQLEEGRRRDWPNQVARG